MAQLHSVLLEVMDEARLKRIVARLCKRAERLVAVFPRRAQVLAALLDAMDPGCAASMVEVQMAEGQGSRLSDPAHIVRATKEMLAEEAARLGKK